MLFQPLVLLQLLDLRPQTVDVILLFQTFQTIPNSQNLKQVHNFIINCIYLQIVFGSGRNVSVDGKNDFVEGIWVLLF